MYVDSPPAMPVSRADIRVEARRHPDDVVPNGSFGGPPNFTPLEFPGECAAQRQRLNLLVSHVYSSHVDLHTQFRNSSTKSAPSAFFCRRPSLFHSLGYSLSCRRAHLPAIAGRRFRRDRSCGHRWCILRRSSTSLWCGSKHGSNVGDVLFDFALL